MIEKMNIAFIATLALLSTLYSCKKETTTNSELTVGTLELVAETLNVAEAKFKVAINDPADVARKKKLCYSTTVQSPTIDTAGNAVEQDVVAVAITDPNAIALTNLKTNTTHYVRAAVVTKSGAIVYSNVVKVKTLTIPVGTLRVVEEIGFDVVTLSAAAGSGGVIAGSVYYSTASNPTTGEQLINNMGQVQLKGLIPGTTYYARIGVSTVSGEVIYGPEISFTIRPCTIGTEYKGGIIFHIDATKAHGLIAAKEDIGESYPDTETDKKIFPWGLNGIELTTSITDGLTNTNEIKRLINNDAISAQTAAGQCSMYKPSDPAGFVDGWYLPATEEWIILANNESVIPKLKPDHYWTSTGVKTSEAWRMNLGEKELTKRLLLFVRDQKARVRAIHKF